MQRARGSRVLPPLGQARRPRHPGRFLDTRFLRPAGLTQEALAQQLGMSRRRLNELIVGRRGITADTALKLALRFGTDIEFWLHLQAAWDARQVWDRHVAPESR
jgi:addiction module HigA family antidote